jgi:hypothetical protein
MDLLISPTGEIHCLYSEHLDLSTLGRPTIRRASHVEPTHDGHWTADLAPLGGPLLGPFLLRSEALAAEIVWIEENWRPMPG